jgi:putative toxin-antitoxin system antitoxin component (TIGR02293 family)
MGVENFPQNLEFFPTQRIFDTCDRLNMFNMPAVMDDPKVQKVLKKYEKKYDNNIALFLSAKNGLEPQAAFDLIDVTSLTSKMIESILYITIKTLTNYKQHKTHLNASISEKVLSIFALYRKGILIFGSVDSLNKWMATPAYGLGEQRPNELLGTMTGINLIMEELTRIEYGDLA